MNVLSFHYLKQYYMRKYYTRFLLFVLLSAWTNSGIAQNSDQGNQPVTLSESASRSIVPEGHKKGTFFIVPFYEYTHFKKLELKDQINRYDLWEGSSSYNLNDEQITEYNDVYGTEYQNSMTALKVGYQLFDGLGLSGYLGLSHFVFKSWVSNENTQTVSAQYPALTMGLAFDYQKALCSKVTTMTILSYNYCTTNTVDVDNSSGEDVVSSQLKSSYWEINQVLAYRWKKFLPYAGVGFTQQFVNSVHKEQIATTNNLEQEVFNTTEFDANYRGTAFYGFAGMEYQCNKYLSIYLRSSFMNPLRGNLGLRIIL